MGNQVADPAPQTAGFSSITDKLGHYSQPGFFDSWGTSVPITACSISGDEVLVPITPGKETPPAPVRHWVGSRGHWGELAGTMDEDKCHGYGIIYLMKEREESGSDVLD